MPGRECADVVTFPNEWLGRLRRARATQGNGPSEGTEHFLMPESAHGRALMSGDSLLLAFGVTGCVARDTGRVQGLRAAPR